MKNKYQHSIQLSFNFESTTEVSIAQNVKSESRVTNAQYYACSRADFEASQAIENDIMHGAYTNYLYQQILRDEEYQRKVRKSLDEFEALQAEAYKYNF